MTNKVIWLKRSTQKEVIEFFKTNQTANCTCTICSKGLLTNRVDYIMTWGCCSSCALNGGYLHPSYSQEDIKQIKKDFNFNSTTGFLTKTGCSIPREHRSTICNRYMCPTLYTRLKDSGVDEQFLNGIYDYNSTVVKRIYTNENQI